MRIYCLSLLLGLCVSTTAVRAFTLTPMSATFDPKGRGSAQTFRVNNDTSKRIAFQMLMLTRHMDENGKETNAPASDLFTVFPPQGAIAPGKSQVVRIVWKGPPNLAEERAFRLVAEELPVDFTQEKQKAQIRVILRYMAAIYVSPRNAKPDLQAVEFVRDGTNTYVLSVTNAGTAHGYLINPKLTLIDAEGGTHDVPVDSLGPVSGENVLAGHTRRFVLVLPARFTEPSYRAQLITDE